MAITDPNGLPAGRLRCFRRLMPEVFDQIVQVLLAEILVIRHMAVTIARGVADKLTNHHGGAIFGDAHRGIQIRRHLPALVIHGMAAHTAIPEYRVASHRCGIRGGPLRIHVRILRPKIHQGNARELPRPGIGVGSALFLTQPDQIERSRVYLCAADGLPAALRGEAGERAASRPISKGG
jgi:hypothetical protein